MSYRTVMIPVFALILMLGLLAGCSDSGTDAVPAATTGSDSYDTMDFAQPYGGLTVSDEAEAFDDDALKMMLYAEEDEAIDDPLARDPEVLLYEAMGSQSSDPTDRTRPKFTYVKLRWGMLRGPEDTVRVEQDCDRTDWTGEIHTDRGLVVVRRLIRFEKPADHVIFPRLDHQTVAFVSHTRCGQDGLILQIIERPAAADSVEVAPNMLHINTGPFQGEYNVADLASLDEVTDVDALGNRFQITGFRLSDIAYCPKGFLSGRYKVKPVEDAVDPANEDLQAEGQRLGRMAGAFTDLTGRISGFMRGGYGINAEGEKVFHAKYIGRRGDFRGLISGHWEAGDSETDLATFTGHWVSASGNREGKLGGEAHPVEDYPGGFYVGRWTTLCDEEAEAETP